MIYLASPYSSPHPAVREKRFRAACQATACLVRAGDVVFSPVVNSHSLAEYGMPTGWDFWERIDREFVERCDEVVVLKLEGWDVSIGVLAEIKLAIALGKPVRCVAPEEVPQ